MAKVPLDTDILSEYLKGYDRTVIRHAADYARQHGVFTFTSVTVHEIVYGLELKGASAQVHICKPPPIKATARKQGSIVEPPDCLIAAVAVRLALPLVTGNTEDFQAIQRTGIALHIENWRNP